MRCLKLKIWRNFRASIDKDDSMTLNVSIWDWVQERSLGERLPRNLESKILTDNLHRYRMLKRVVVFQVLKSLRNEEM